MLRDGQIVLQKRWHPQQRNKWYKEKPNKKIKYKITKLKYLGRGSIAELWLQRKESVNLKTDQKKLPIWTTERKIIENQRYSEPQGYTGQ